MIANDSFKYIALYVNCSLCYVTKVKGEWLPRTKNTLTTMPQDKKPQKSKDGKAPDITHARHSQHVQLKVSLNLMFFRWDWSWTTTQITFMTDTLCTLLLIRLILFLNISYSYFHFHELIELIKFWLIYDVRFIYLYKNILLICLTTKLHF